MEPGRVFRVGKGRGVRIEEIARLLRERPGRGLGGDNAVARSLTAEGAPGMPAVAAPEARPAAVLVPLVDRPDGLTVLLTRRTAHLANHAGQISFPGGRQEEADESPESCALRETLEEIGLAAERVQILGRLDDYLTVTGFRVVPVVGWVSPPFTLSPDPFEVDEVFEVPLAFLLDPANHQRHERIYNGRPRPYWAMPYGDYYIWGATAGMLVNLSRVLRP